MKIINFDYDTENGFAWIVIEGSIADETLVVQCCLSDRSFEDAESDAAFEAKIIADDCGADEGLCADANEKAFECYGQSKCLKALFSKASEMGLEIV